MSAYSLLTFLHSILRWLLLGLLVSVAARSARARGDGAAWRPRDERAHKVLVAVADTQLLAGLALYFFVSPLSQAFLAAPAAAMRLPTLRFFGMEHAAGMILAVAALHVGRVLSKRAEGAARHRRVLVSTLVALAIAIALTPWPGLPYGRPLV